MKGQFKEKFVEWTAYIFIALFMYTASDKLWNVNGFAHFLEKIEFLSLANTFFAWAIPATEIIVSFLLLFKATRKWGIYAAFSLMVLFTGYLMYMKLSGNQLPCHCGGVINKLNWVQHIWFNAGFILLAGLSIRYISVKDKHHQMSY